MAASTQRISVVGAGILVAAAVVAAALTRPPSPPAPAPDAPPPPRVRLPPARPLPDPALWPDAEPVQVGELEVSDPIVGAGAPLQPWQIAVVEVTWWAADGTVVDSTAYRKRPGRVVLQPTTPGSTWDDALPWMRIGGLRRITGPGLGWIDVELVDVLEPPTRPDPFHADRVIDGMPVVDLTPGAGPVPPADAVRVLEITTWTDPSPPEAGDVPLDSTLLRGTPYELGPGTPLAFAAAIRDLRIGGRRLVGVPPELAFGPAGVPPLVPPGAAVILDVRLLGVE